MSPAFVNERGLFETLESVTEFECRLRGCRHQIGSRAFCGLAAEKIGAEKLHGGSQLAGIPGLDPAHLAHFTTGDRLTEPLRSEANQFHVTSLAIGGADDGVEILDARRDQDDAELLADFAFQSGLGGFPIFDFPTGQIPMLILPDPHEKQGILALIDETGAAQRLHDRTIT